MNNSAIKILILDDEPFMHKLLMRMLANLGFTSASACDNGRAALELVDSQEGCPDLILLDLNMPESRKWMGLNSCTAWSSDTLPAA